MREVKVRNLRYVELSNRQCFVIEWFDFDGALCAQDKYDYQSTIYFIKGLKDSGIDENDIFLKIEEELFWEDE